MDVTASRFALQCGSMSLSAAPSLAHATLPKGQLLYAVGDIHGRADLLEAKLGQIEADAHTSGQFEHRTLVFLGDYVDRGPDSHGVVETLIGGLPQGFETHFLKGDHEAMLLNFLDDPWTLEHWLMNGGEATMRSCGVDADRLARIRSRPTYRPGAARYCPRRVLRSTVAEAQRVVRRLFILHAGVNPGAPLDARAKRI